MADSFADLWNSSAPSSSKQKDHATLQKLGSSLPNKSSHPAIRRPGHPQSDLFSMLASASAVSPGNTKSTSETMSRLTGSPQPQAQSRSGTPSDRPLAKTESMDAFGSLLGSSFTSYAKNSDFGKVTLADHDIRTTNSVTPIHNNKTEGVDVWRGLDTLGSANTPAPKGLRNDVEDFLGIGASGTGAGSGSPNRHIPPANVLDDDDWGLSDFAATHVPTGSSENRSLAQSQSSGYPGVESAVGSSGRGLGHGNEVGDDAEANLLGDFGEPRTKKSGPYPHSVSLIYSILHIMTKFQQAYIRVCANTPPIHDSYRLSTSACRRANRRNGFLSSAGKNCPCSHRLRSRCSAGIGDASSRWSY